MIFILDSREYGLAEAPAFRSVGDNLRGEPEILAAAIKRLPFPFLAVLCHAVYAAVAQAAFSRDIFGWDRTSDTKEIYAIFAFVCLHHEKGRAGD
ncbi:hypothetical protein PG991_006106 [Apiospora marii]|uniref:Uncharacterized protein n=1 Tax=Apiospora marii TaxID=335849 RepID=A0ABR1SB75_9PEZI